MTYYTRKDGTYLGDFDGPLPKKYSGAVAVDSPPEKGGMYWSGSKWLEVGKTWGDVRELQKELLSSDADVSWRKARYVSQEALNGHTPKEKPGKMQDLLRYEQDVRECDELGTPELAIEALKALKVPSE